tara:strand:+ start:937 stop:2124 length:1188 start_codon:yes stop_codon:yes gene_type:complete
MEGYLLILGAGIYQLPLIKKARKRNIKTIVVSPKGNYPGIKYADKYWAIDVRNHEEILDLCKKEKLIGVLTSGSDISIPTLGKIVDTFNLIGPSSKAANNTCNKLIMKNIFKNNDIPTAKFYAIESYQDAINASKKIGFPFMIKAIDSSGSRGITKVLNSNQIFTAWENAKTITCKKQIIAEKFLRGKEYGAQIFVQKKKIIAISFHNDTSKQSRTSIPIGHSLPSNLDSKVIKKLCDIFMNCIECLDINNTVCNVDFIVNRNKIYIIEIGARIGATCIPELISINTGIDVYNYLIDLSLGIFHEFRPLDNIPTAAILITSQKSGFIKEITIPKELKKDYRLIDFQLDIEENSYVKKFQCGSDRLGHIIVKEESWSSAEKLANKLASEIHFKVDS